MINPRLAQVKANIQTDAPAGAANECMEMVGSPTLSPLVDQLIAIPASETLAELVAQIQADGSLSADQKASKLECLKVIVFSFMRSN